MIVEFTHSQFQSQYYNKENPIIEIGILTILLQILFIS